MRAALSKLPLDWGFITGLLNGYACSLPERNASAASLKLPALDSYNV